MYLYLGQEGERGFKVSQELQELIRSGFIQELKLSDRQWVCKSCGVLHDRDYNAAKNIRRVGQTLQEVTYASAQSVSWESPLFRAGECQ